MNANPDISITDLRADLNGSVIAPDDPGYDDARGVFFTGFDRRPAAIVQRRRRIRSRPARSTSLARRAPSSRSAAAATAAPGTGPPTAGSSSTSPR